MGHSLENNSMFYVLFQFYGVTLFTRLSQSCENKGSRVCDLSQNSVLCGCHWSKFTTGGGGVVDCLHCLAWARITAPGLL